MLFVCYPKCTTCQKAKKWLEEKGGVLYPAGHQDGEPHPGGAADLVAGERPALKKFFNTSGSSTRP